MPLDRPQVRAFLSSTFSDFHEERDLLAKQVFPALRQKAKGRGVEVVDVDLRWGITEEQSQQGQTLPICLAEIENCRPYFIGLLGERYGWVPEPDQYSPELLERQGWLREHQGGASVTELEILHGVLNNPDMAGRALFYFRDPAYSTARAEAGEPGWRSEGEQERQKLEALKQRIRASGFPVLEGLADPQAIAERIEADLWALIERQFPEGEQPDALAIEAARHASYRADRTGLYLGGEGYIQQLEQWIDSGEQRLLITGDSGSGKSTLIANWMAAHGQSHPEDVIYSHHLGCSNDANAVRPLLARLIDTAAQLIEEDIKVPQDWWELVAAVGETLARLSLWARRRGCRWIWVLDGLDKLSTEDQQALPWLPVTLPEGIHVVTSALDCPARTILQERNYRSLAIGPLQRPEQEALIDRYLRIFARQLDSGLKEQLLSHPLAGSPLFLRVLLEELRQCGRFDTLQQQLDGYLSAQTIDDMYERVLERLEADGHGEAVQKALTALWASRAGLSEPELLAITGLTPAAWAPIGIGLQAALGENQGRLVFGHDFLRIAVQDRYLPTEEQQRQAHSDLADWFRNDERLDPRAAEELPWQLQASRRITDLRDVLLDPRTLSDLSLHLDFREIIGYWLEARHVGALELDELVTQSVEAQISQNILGPEEEAVDLVWSLTNLLENMGLRRAPLLRLYSHAADLALSMNDASRQCMSFGAMADIYMSKGLVDDAISLRKRCLDLCAQLEGAEHSDTLTAISDLAWVYEAKGDYAQAEGLYRRCLEIRERLLGSEHPDTLTAISDLAWFYTSKRDYKRAEALYRRCLDIRERLLGARHPDTLATIGRLAALFYNMGDYERGREMFDHCVQVYEQLADARDPGELRAIASLAFLYKIEGHYEQAETLYRRRLEFCERLLGAKHPDTVNAISDLAGVYRAKGDYVQAEAQYQRCLQIRELLLGDEHPDTLEVICDLAEVHESKRDYKQAEVLYQHCMQIRERLLGAEHYDTLTAISSLAWVYLLKEDYEQAEALYQRCLEVRERLLGAEHPDALVISRNLAFIYNSKGDFEREEVLLKRCLEIRERLLGAEHPDTLETIGDLALACQNKGDREKANVLFEQYIEATASISGDKCPRILTAIKGLARVCKSKGDYGQAEALFRRCLEIRERLYGSEHPGTLKAISDLAGVFRTKGDYEQAEVLYERCLGISERLLGVDHPDTLDAISDLAWVCRTKGDYEQAKVLYQRCLGIRERLLGADHPDTLDASSDLAWVCWMKGDYKQAEELYQNCLRIRERLFGADHSDTLTATRNLAWVYWLKEDYLQAEVLYQRCLEMRERLLEADHPDTLDAISDLARVYKSKEDYEQAEVLYRRCLEIRERLLGADDPDVLDAVEDLAGVYRAKGDYVQAEAQYQRCLETRERLLGLEHPDTLRTAYFLAHVFSFQGCFLKAIPLYRRRLSWCRRQNGNTDPSTLTTLNQLAIALRETGKLEEAEALFRELVTGRQEALESSDSDIGRALGGLAMTLEAAGKLEEAAAFAQQALTHRLEHEGSNAWWTNRERLDLARILHKLERNQEALTLLDDLQSSLNSYPEQDDDDRELLSNADELRSLIEAKP